MDRPKPPFITSTLQQEAARKLGFSSARTMAVAQRLYENGFITYMRTDSTNLSSEAISGGAAMRFGSAYGDEYPARCEPRSYRGKVKNAQEAHEAIRPSAITLPLPDDRKSHRCSADEPPLYELIWTRTIACQMADARVSGG